MIAISSMIIFFFLITGSIAVDAISNDNSTMNADYDAMIWGSTNLYSDYCELKVNFEKFITHHTDKYAVDCARIKVAILAKKEQVVVRSKIVVGEQSLYCEPGGDSISGIGMKFRGSFGEWTPISEPIKEYIYLKENESICLLFDILIHDRDIDKKSNFLRHIATVEYNPSKTNLSSKVSSEILKLIPETTAKAYCDIPIANGRRIGDASQQITNER